MSDPETVAQRLQWEVEAIARNALLRRPPGTAVADVWNEALSIHRQLYTQQKERENTVRSGGHAGRLSVDPRAGTRSSGLKGRSC